VWVICTGWTNPTTYITPVEHGLQSGFRELGIGGVDPPLTAATLSGGSPNLTGAEGAAKFGVCWANRGRAGVRVDVSADK